MNKLFLIYIGIVCMMFTSCESFLEEENLSSVVADELYATEEGYEGLVNSCYSSLRDVYGNEPWLLCAGTDLYVEGRSTQPDGISEYKNLTSSDSNVETFFTNLYKSIQYCNTALNYSSSTEESDVLAQRIAEVKFLRAINYFSLVQHFGGVSIVTEMINEPIVSFERSSAADVYSFIITELESTVADLPETADEFGRASKRAVYHYLSKVYLTRGYQSFASANDFSTAASYAEQAINGQGLDLTYEELFTPGNEMNDEILFSVQYDAESLLDPMDDGNMQNYFFSPYLGGEGSTKGYPYRSYNLCPTMYALDLYTADDARWEATFMNVVYDQYYDYYDGEDSRADLEVTYYFPQSWELADTAAWRAESELRANAIIRPYSSEWQASTSSTEDWETPITKKFDDPKSDFSNKGSNSRDIFLARLGETYLIAAEAYLQAGNATKATEMINVVRTRAAKSGSEAAMQLAEADVDVDKILDERALELFGEYHRWEDLARTGKLVERTQLYNRDIKEWFDNGINPFEGNDGELKLLRPIPQDALDLNKNDDYVQNPGY